MTKGRFFNICEIYELKEVSNELMNELSDVKIPFFIYSIPHGRFILEYGDEKWIQFPTKDLKQFLSHWFEKEKNTLSAAPSTCIVFNFNSQIQVIYKVLENVVLSGMIILSYPFKLINHSSNQNSYPVIDIVTGNQITVPDDFPSMDYSTISMQINKIGCIITDVLGRRLKKKNRSPAGNDLSAMKEIPNVYKNAFETCPNGMCFYHKKYGIINYNRSLSHFLGHSESDNLLGRNIDFLFSECHEIDYQRKMRISSLLKIAQMRGTIQSSLIITNKDRSIFYADVSISRIEVENSIYFHIIVIDRTNDYQIREQSTVKNRLNSLIGTVTSLFYQKMKTDEIVTYFCKNIEKLLNMRGIIFYLESRDANGINYNSLLSDSNDITTFNLSADWHQRILNDIHLQDSEIQYYIVSGRKKLISFIKSHLIDHADQTEIDPSELIEKYCIKYIHFFPLKIRDRVMGFMMMNYITLPDSWIYETIPLIIKRLVYTIDHNNLHQQLEETSEKLKLNNEELKNFAHVISHDLKEPLHTIAAYIQLISNRYSDNLDKTGLEFMNFVIDGVERMNGMVNGLLSLNRINTAGTNFTMIDLNRVFEAVLSNLRNQVERTHAQVDIDPHLPPIYGDYAQIIQLLQNLVTNAIKFVAKDVTPRVTVQAEPDNEFTVISIRDNGIGIPEKHRVEIFRIFRRLNPLSQYEGTGMGLSICERIMERHKGRIVVESEVDKGTVFYLSFPKMRQ